MVNKIKIYFFQLVESYLFVVVMALFIGLFWSSEVVFLNSYTTLFLQIIFFLSSLKIDLKEFRSSLKDIRADIAVVAYMLFLLPLVTYIISRIVVPDMAVALMLLAAMPAGMTTPLLTEVVGGNVAYALVLTVLTSLLAPFSIPLVTKLLIGTQVNFSATEMFLKLLFVIFIPFVIAQIVRRFAKLSIIKSQYTFKPISLVLLGGLITAIVAQNASTITGHLDLLLKELITLLIFFFILQVIGYFLTFWQGRKEKITVSVAVTYGNFTLAIYLSSLYFNTPEVVTPLVISVIAWSLSLVPFKFIVNKYLNK